MKSTLLVLALMMTLQAPAVLAVEPQETRPHSGVLTGIGMFAGAILGGPGYAIAAFTLGAVYDTQQDKKFALQKSLERTRHDYADLKDKHQHELVKMQQQQAESEARFQLASTKWSNSISKIDQSIGYTLQFRTAVSDIEPHYIKDLTSLAQLLKEMPELRLQLAGFSDRMGEETFNQQLSLQRVKRVEHFFMQNGIDQHRIESHAYGESHPLNNTSGIEDNSFERRVIISVNPPLNAVVSN